MVYDSNLISDDSDINQVVFYIRDKICSGPTATILISDLVKVMSIETCEMFLNSMGHLPYIPVRQFNGMTSNQIAAFFKVPVSRIRCSLNKCSKDSVYYAYSDLALLAISEEERFDTRVRPSILTFSNGTRFDETGRKYYVYNARAILYVAVMLSDMEPECRQVVNLIVSTIRKSYSEWLVLKKEPEPEHTPVDTPSEPIQEAPQSASEGHIGLSLVEPINSLDRAENAPEVPLRGSDDIFAKFLSILPPGAELVIRVPEIKAVAPAFA